MWVGSDQPSIFSIPKPDFNKLKVLTESLNCGLHSQALQLQDHFYTHNMCILKESLDRSKMWDTKGGALNFFVLVLFSLRPEQHSPSLGRD